MSNGFSDILSNLVCPEDIPLLLQKILMFFELSIWIEASEWW
jgi:hypothetical protein